MLLLEYEARELLAKYGIPVENACIARSLEEVEECMSTIQPPLVLKAQVPLTGRGKRGGILFADDPREAVTMAKKLFSSRFDSHKVDAVLVAERVDVTRELYLAFMIDRNKKSILLLASPAGGVDVEEASGEDKVLMLEIDPLVGLRDYAVRKAIKHLGIRENDNQAYSIIRNLYRLFTDYMCELAEVNPLAETDRGLVAVDRRIIIDDSFLRISPQLRELRNTMLSRLPRVEREAYEYGFSYVKLEGDVGVVGNGAGLTMATMDLVRLYGGSPGAFLDLGGGASAARVEKALKVMLSDRMIGAVVVNILGGITRCDEVARGIVSALRGSISGKRIYVRLQGLNEEEGREILKEAGINVYEDAEEAVKATVKFPRD